MLDLSIIILNFKTKGLLKYCLKSIREINLAIPHEIIVVDNASCDGTKQMLEQNFPNVIPIESKKNLGFPGGVNLGIAAAKGKYLLILNPDIIVEPQSIENLIVYLDRHANVGMVGPQLKNPNRTIQQSCYRFPTFAVPFYRRTWCARFPWAAKTLREYLMEDFDHRTLRSVDWLLGGCVMVRRQAIDQVGPLDERFFMYFDDTDWGRRFWEKNWSVVYCPHASMIHYHQRESAGAPLLRSIFTSKPTRAHIASWIKYLLKYRNQPTPKHSDEAPV